MKGLAFVFPGQGSQYIGMGQELAKAYPIARETFEEANKALGFDLMELIFSGDINELTRTENTQPALLATSVAVYRVFSQEFGITPEYMAGHSLGEYSALVAAGALEFADALKLVQKRGQFMQEAVPVGTGSMMAVLKLPKTEVEAIIKEVSIPTEIVQAANYNSPEQVVISGHASAIERALQALEKAGATVRLLQVSAPFHSILMEPAAVRMRDELAKVDYHPLTCPIISNVTALPYQNVEGLGENLTTQITAPVRWQETMQFMVQNGITRVIEMGPKNVLQTLFKRTYPNIEAYTLEKTEELERLKTILPYRDFQKVITKAIAAVVCTRNQNWDNAAYEAGVIKPYKELQELQMLGAQITQAHAEKALELVNKVFVTKMLPEAERRSRFIEIIEASGTRNHLQDVVNKYLAMEALPVLMTN